MQKKKQRQLRARPQFQPMFPEMLLVCLVLPYFHLQYTFNTKAATVVQRKDRAAFGLSVVFCFSFTCFDRFAFACSLFQLSFFQVPGSLFLSQATPPWEKGRQSIESRPR